MELKLLITGSHGFIGSSLGTQLSERNMPWIGFVGNLLEKEDIENFFKVHKIEMVVHLVGTFDEPFDKQMQLNFDTTRNLIEIGLKYGLKKIIYASTGAVYGEPIREKSFEEDNLLPNTFYGLSKKLTEELITYYTRQKILESVILRFPNVYGKGNNKGVIYNFKESITSFGKVILYGDGTQKRNFLYVLDAVSAILCAITYKDSGIFNIATHDAYSLNEVLATFSRKYDFNIQTKQANNNLKNLILDINKAEKELGFTPKYNNLIL